MLVCMWIILIQDQRLKLEFDFWLLQDFCLWFLDLILVTFYGFNFEGKLNTICLESAIHYTKPYISIFYYFRGDLSVIFVLYLVCLFLLIKYSTFNLFPCRTDSCSSYIWHHVLKRYRNQENTVVKQQKLLSAC